jgi:hypothetical protein
MELRRKTRSLNLADMDTRIAEKLFSFEFGGVQKASIECELLKSLLQSNRCRFLGVHEDALIECGWCAFGRTEHVSRMTDAVA